MERREELERARREKALAEAELARAEAAGALALAQLRQLEAELTRTHLECERITLERERYKRQKELAEDEHHRVYRFTSSVDAGSVKACMSTLQSWSRIDPKCPMTVVFSSPGGSIIEGMALFDFLQEMRRQGHRITTIARGYAASMAGILLQAGDWRIMGAESYLLIHEASFGAVGSFGEVEDMVKFVEKIQDRVLNIFAQRSAAADPKTATKKLSKAQIKKRWHRKDWWLSSDEALAHGFIDEIA